MAIDVELKTLKQNNTSWPLTFKASNRFPIVANRVFATLENAQAYINDTAADASAYPGIVLAVVQDDIAKNNGVYYVQSVAMTEGESGVLVKVGGTETETADKYSEAVELSKTLVVGQLIKVANDETIGELTYQAGFYIVEGAGVISALATSTGSDDEVGALKTRVTALETDKVDKVEGYRLMSDAEGTKLKGIAEGAEVNFVKSVQGPLAVDTDGMLTVDLSSKVDKNDYTSAMTAVNNAIASKTDYSAFTEHVQDGNVHITSDERNAWNAAEQNAKDYADNLVMDGETPRFDANGAAAEALDAAKGYADGLASNYDAAGAAAEALDAAKGYADGLASNYDAAGAATQALEDAQKYTDEEIEKAIGVYASEGVEASGLRKEIAEVAAEAKSYSMVAVEGEELSGLGTNVREAYKLVDEDNERTGDYIKIYKDSALKSVVLENQTLNFTYILADGSEDTVGVDVSAFLAESEFGDGLQVVEHLVSVKVAEGSESFLTVDKNGVKLSGVQGAIDTAKKSATDYTDSKISEVQDNIDALAAIVGEGAEGETDTVMVKLAALAAHDAAQDEEIGKKAAKSDLESLSNTVATKAAQSDLDALAAIVGNRAEGDTESVMTKIAALAEGKLDVTATINGQGFVDGAAVINAGDIKLSEKTNSYDESLTLQSVIASLDSRITSAVSGGLTSVAAGNGVSVSAVAGNSQTISLKCRESETNAVVIDENGIYVEQIMVDGNDTEE
jgi:antitoxin component YwqK of YwqJK toxin-antitoxin module